MGNTNLPQAGAADAGNSRDTLSGKDQLTEQQQEDGRDEQHIGPSPSRPRNAPERIPGQQRGPDTIDENGHERNPNRNESVEQPADDEPANRGYADTGHPPSGAT